MKIDLTKYDKEHAAYIESLTGKLTSIYNSIIRYAVKYGLSVNFDPEEGEIFDFSKFPRLKKRVDELFRDMQSQITTLVQNAIAEEWQFSAEKYDFFLQEMLAKTGMSEKEIKQYIERNTKAIQERRNEALEAFQKRKQNGLDLSDRVWNLTDQFKRELELSLDVGIREGKSADEISRMIRGYLNNPDKLFRRVRDKHGNLKLSKAAAAYHPGMGVYRSSYKNALRVARTEVNMAYRSADHENWKMDNKVIGIRISLSNNHTLNGKPFVDICDYLAGTYPKDFKFTGWHPQCRCWAAPVTPSQKEIIQYLKKVKDGEDVTNYKFEGEVTEMPKAFKNWYAENASRVEKMKSKPYFIKDNEKVIDKMRKEKKEPETEESSNLDEVIALLGNNGVKYNEVKERTKEATDDEIISEVGGGDLTKGSCSSLAFAYLGNKLGYYVLDFRDGKSRQLFSSSSVIMSIAEKVGGVVARNTNDLKKANELLKTVQEGKEYYFTCGAHAAVVRKTEEGFQYLELQSSKANGFKKLTTDILKWRFGAKKSRSSYGQKIETRDCIIDIDLLRKDSKFKELLGYINTPEKEQMKGEKGTMR